MNGTTDFDYVYNLEDHLGNVRVSFPKDGTGSALINTSGALATVGFAADLGQNMTDQTDGIFDTELAVRGVGVGAGFIAGQAATKLKFPEKVVLPVEYFTGEAATKVANNLAKEPVK